MNYAKARHNMVASQIRTWDVSNPDVLALMEQLPREDFVPENLRQFAYADMAIPLENGQTMLPPKEQGRILQAVSIKPSDRILEVCTGTGYLTTLCAQLGNFVVSVDINPAQQAQAKKNLAKYDIKNVEFVTADGSQGFIHDETFDVIIITGGLAELPSAYKHILNLDGRIFAIIGKAPLMRATLFTHPGTKLWQETVLYETVVPMMEQAKSIEEFNF
jgi:protein-L-isoaspartate(D-aspartate) O-methyltransferase